MALDNAQYDQIMRTYQQRQLENQHRLQQRRNAIFQTVPRVAEIQDEIASLSISHAKARILQKNSDRSAYNSRITELKRERTQLLLENGYPPDALKLQYHCPDCQDTGMTQNGKCHCFIKEIIHFLYHDSNLRNILEQENFHTFSYHYYPDNYQDSITETTPKENIQKIVKICRNFIDNFPNVYDNLIFYGATGVGKSFLTHCIAKELLDKAYSVIYLSAIQLFDFLAASQFSSKETKAAAMELAKHIYECDLLIIDDLGTEMTNSFTHTALFNCLNERHCKQKSTIISTNLSIEELKNTYSERIFSRITSHFRLMKVIGKDIRVQKRLENNGGTILC